MRIQRRFLKARSDFDGRMEDLEALFCLREQCFAAQVSAKRRIGEEKKKKRYHTYRTCAAIDAPFSKPVVALKMVDCLGNVAEVEYLLQGLRGHKGCGFGLHFMPVQRRKR